MSMMRSNRHTCVSKMVWPIFPRVVSPTSSERQPSKLLCPGQCKCLRFSSYILSLPAAIFSQVTSLTATHHTTSLLNSWLANGACQYYPMSARGGGYAVCQRTGTSFMIRRWSKKMIETFFYLIILSVHTACVSLCVRCRDFNNIWIF